MPSWIFDRGPTRRPLAQQRGKLPMGNKSDLHDVSYGSKAEQLTMSKSCPRCPQERTSRRATGISSADQIGRPLGDHDHGRVDVAADEVWHNSGVDDAQSGCAEHAQ